MSQIQIGDFKLNSGARSDFKIEFDNATDEDIAGYAYLISKCVGPFGSVEGVPRGGLRLAAALDKYAKKAEKDTHPLPHLIVDDVLTTGGSMARVRDAWIGRGSWGPLGTPPPLIIGAVAYARGPCPDWVTPLFQLPRQLWLDPNPGWITMEEAFR